MVFIGFYMGNHPLKNGRTIQVSDFLIIYPDISLHISLPFGND